MNFKNGGAQQVNDVDGNGRRTLLENFTASAPCSLSVRQR